MDSLLANYAGASSDEEQEDEPPPPPPPTQIVKAPTSNSKPSLFSSIPQPKQSSSCSSSLFSSLPQPKSQSSFPNPNPNPNPNPSSNPPNPKRIVQFTPPINPSLLKKPSRDDEDDDDEEEERKRRARSQSSSQAPSVHSFLSSIPAPKHFSSTLGVLHSSGGGRRSIIETEGPAPGPSNSNETNATEAAVTATANGEYYGDVSTTNYENYASGYGQNGGNYSYYDGYGSYQDAGFEQSADPNGAVDPNYNNVAVYGDNSSYGYGCGDYGYSGFGGSEGMEMQQGSVASAMRVLGKRGRNNNEIPAEIVEVKQDELMKDRPREDQMKLTGIAFGPSHQPVSAKGKPSKLHKRKHQIGSLYYDMKQKEMELQERRARGLLTKSQTQGKYGW